MMNWGPAAEARIEALKRYDRFLDDSQIEDFRRDESLTAEAIFTRECSSCHNMNKVSEVGPHLESIVGRDVGGIENFNYSTALASSDTVWTPELLKDFLLQENTRFSNSTMPKINLSISEADSVIHYLSR